MLFIRLYDEQLAQASYLIGCGVSGAAVVIDPNRLVDQYIAAAERAGLTITAVTETHIHADFVSGTRELAARTGATMYLSGCGPPEWQYEFAAERGVTLLKDRECFRSGNVELRAVHTPGHTPEHLSFLVTDRANAVEPMGIASGDFVFVNDVGRPDLLEKAARIEGSAEAGATALFRSLRWFKSLPDHLQVWPGHGAGSACGKEMSPVPQSTVGYERRYNWALGVDDERAFVAQVLAGQPEPPRYFAEMKRLNRAGPAVLGALPLPERVAEHRLASLLASEAVIVDTRAAADFAAGHVPGTLNIPFNNSFATWAGSLLPYDRELYFILDGASPDRLRKVVETLLLIGLERVRGYFASDALELWVQEGQALEQLEQLSVSELARRRNGTLILDVRGRSEWEAGHLAGALLIPLAELPDRLGEVPADQPVAIHCQGGGRSAIAASLLQASGRRNVVNVPGGYAAWVKAGLPIAHSS